MTVAAAEQALRITALGDDYRPLARTIDEKAIVNAMVGLAATGGSTNHALHLVAIARAVGLIIDWDDLDELSKATPLLARVYPNGSADVNHFHAAGGLGFRDPRTDRCRPAAPRHRPACTAATCSSRRWNRTWMT